MSTNKREFAFYTLTFSATSAKYKFLPAYETHKYIEWILGAHKESSKYVFSRGKKSYYIQCALDNKDHIWLLIRYIDGDSRDHTIEDIQTSTKKDISKAATEGDAYTSHIYIQKKPVNGKLKMIVEVNSGFSLGMISNIFNGLLKVYLKSHKIFVTVPDLNGAQKDNKEITMIKWPVIEARGTLSDQFEDEIAGASITEIELIASSTSSANLETVGSVYEDRTTVKLKVDSKLSIIGVNAIKKIAGLNTKKYEEIAISYKKDGRKPLRARLECDVNLSPINADRLIKKVVIDSWKSKIKHAYEEIQNEVLVEVEKFKNE
jgi:hypothetical protein